MKLIEKTQKKISLLTFNNALSYGAVLQTYALVKALEEFNLYVEIIDFKSPFSPPIPTGFWSLKTYYNIDRLKREILFYKFRKKYLDNKTKTFWTQKTLKQYNFDSDIYIIGSDQVWNPDITKKYVNNYFFDFVKGNKISYAASFGKSEWNYSDEFNKKIGDLLKQFHAISVRETSGKVILKEKFGIASEIVLDPTLLYANFSELLPTYSEKKQIAAFQVNYNEEFISVVENIQNQLKMPIFLIDSTVKHKSIHPVAYPSVQEWLRYIAESSFIITDSFHGVAFSIIYKKNFVVLMTNEKRFTRIQNLLEALNLTNRIIYHTSDSQQIDEMLLNNIDYSEVSSLLLTLQEESYRFLSKSLNIAR